MKNAKEILDFYILSGVDEVIAQNPFAFADNSQKKQASIGISSVEIAKREAMQANNIDELFEKIMAFDDCQIKKTSKHTIVGSGNKEAKYMFIIDAPGDDDERYGKILSGKSGEFIKNFIKAININEGDCFFSTLLPWRPPGSRAPTELEVETCKPFLEKQISFIKPQKIFAFGIESSQILANNKKTINQLREEKIIYNDINGNKTEIIPSFAISYLMFNPNAKAKLWDFLIKCD